MIRIWGKHPLLISCLLAKLCAVLTGSRGSIFKSVPRLHQRHPCCGFSLTISFLDHSSVSRPRVPPLFPPGLRSSSALLLSRSAKLSTICNTLQVLSCLSDSFHGYLSRTIFLTPPSHASQPYDFLLHFCVIFTMLFLIF